MALFRHRHSGPMPSGRGTAQVLAVSRSDGPSGTRVVLRLLVQLPGTAPYQVEHEERGLSAAATSTVGAVLPVVAEPGGDGGVRVLWGPPAESGAAPGPQVFRSVRSEVRVVDPRDPAAMAEFGPLLRMAERMTGMDLDGDGRVEAGSDDAPAASAGWTVVAPGEAGGIADAVRRSMAANPSTRSATAGGGDTVAQLERLAALHAAGQLTQAEFEAAKRRVLGEPGP